MIFHKAFLNQHVYKYRHKHIVICMHTHSQPIKTQLLGFIGVVQGEIVVCTLVAEAS